MTKSKPRRVILDDVCDEITVGHVGPMADKYLPDGVPFLRSQNVRPFRFDPKEIKFVSPEFHAKLKKSALKPNDVVVTRTGANVGQCCIIPKELPVANCSDLVILRASKELAPHYLMYLLNSPHGRASIDGDLAGAAQPHFNVGSAKRMEVILPDLPTQRTIAGILSAYDDLIENNLRRIKILEKMAQSLYREWFIRFRFPGHESAKFVDSSIGQVPTGWKVKKLEEILELKYGKALKKEDRREGTYPVFGSSGVVGCHDTSLTSGPGIVVGRKGNVGSIFWSDQDFFVIDTAYFVESDVPLRFLFYLLPTLNFINGDAAVPGLSRQQAYSLEAIVPPASLLSKFCALADGFERQASTLRQQSANLRRTRDLLLPKLLGAH